MRVALAATACGDSQQTLCTPPQHTTYSCAPEAAGSGTCLGGPKWTPLGSSDAGIRQDDVGAAFGSGCTALIPDCSPYYIGDPRAFVCSDTVWFEAL